MRRREKAHFYFDQGPDVNHFQYFLNHSTRDKVLSWLTKPEAELAQTGFAEFERGGLPSLEISKPRGDSTKPIVLLIGDFMASHLKDGKKLVWLDFDALMSGGVSDLHKLEPNGLISSAYQDLTKALESRFDVVQFPYKWSASLENEGARLARILDEHLQSKRPVHIIAHGYGGLLLQPALEHVNEPKALGRIVCIATPFLGWDFANQLATGKALITRLLALMDITKTAEKIGALLLPSSAPRANGAVSIPNLVYLAGRPNDRVPYDRAGCHIDYYIDAAHGDLLNYPPAFPGIVEVLNLGSTTRLPASPPPSVQASRAEVVLFPDERDLLCAALGCELPARFRTVIDLHVSVAHGDLTEARYPVLVGHYEGSNIVSSEHRLDQQFDQALSRRHQMGIYPGPFGSVEILRVPKKRPPGAIIVGLGEVGEMTADKLQNAVLRALMRYAIEIAEDPAIPTTEGKTWKPAAFSSLLIGVRGSRPLSVMASSVSIVQAAVEANRTLRAQNLWERVRIDAVEFIELFEDVAIQAAHAIAELPESLRSNLREGERIVAADLLDTREGRCTQRPLDQYDPGWWRRIRIQCKKTSERVGELDYVVSTDRARSEQSVNMTQIKAVEDFVQRAIASTETNAEFAAALYSMLLPNEIKEQLTEKADLLLELDRDSAQYPWELLTPVSIVDAEPLATKMGLIRQFKTANFDEKPRSIVDKRALVIGEPLLDAETRKRFPELPGARAEAESVADLLSKSGYEVTRVIHQNAHHAFLQVLAKDFKILHLAGHGVYDYQGVTGMVLGENLFLTAAEIHGAPSVPEIAFVNCCHLARIDNNPDLQQDEARLGSVNRLAASVAEALIDRGARAVVAAGWAVNDAAADASLLRSIRTCFVASASETLSGKPAS